MRAALKQGLAGGAAWLVAGTLLRVVVSDWTVVDAVARSLVGGCGFLVVYTLVSYYRDD